MGRVSDVVLVRWVEPEARDVPGIVSRVREEAQGKPQAVDYVAVVSSDVPVPDDGVRKALSDTIDEMMEHCRSVHMVIEGRGLRRALVRSLSTSIMLLSRHRGRTFAHDSIESALRNVTGDDEPSVQRMMAEARLKGLLPAPDAPAGA